MHFPDLSAYTYLPPGDPDVLNIGWLSKHHPFPTGDTTPAFLECLKSLVKKRVRLMRGFHQCELCADSKARDSGEVEVTGMNKTKYSAPALVVHYVEAHKYLPPTEFVEAVIKACEQ
jgi:hypothetical protein